MDNKQAAAVLREIIKARRMSPTDKDQLEFAEAEERGADALEFKAWLFERVSNDSWSEIRVLKLRADCQNLSDFLAYCEAKFEESKKHG